MFYVYILQAIGKPDGNVKIGFSSKTANRISALEPGALGERLHAVLQVDAGETSSDGRRLERVYHDHFNLDRINREWFRFNPEMLTWAPGGFAATYPKIGSPASNTVPFRRMNVGDLTIFRRTLIQRPNERKLSVSGDLTAAATVQKVVQYD